jgi:DNA (cytosine-5)-methyltransferase 1
MRLLRFLKHVPHSHQFIEYPKLQDGGQETYEYVGDSVARTVLLSSAQAIKTQVRIAEGGGEDPHSAFDFAFLRRPVEPDTTDDEQSVRVVDIFSGCGGLSLGISEACRAVHKRFVSVLAVDRDPSCITIYRKNLPCEEANQVDITEVIDGTIGSPPTVNERSFLKKIRDVTVLLAGPPCQGNSDLNNHTRRKDPRNALYERVARFVEIVEPEHILVENVAPAIHGKERAIQRTIEVLRREGYYVDSGIVDLSTIGVPQTRKRHVLIASKSKKLSVVDVIERHRVSVTRSVRWAIGDLEHEPPNGPFTTPSKYTERNLRRIRYLHAKGLFELPNKLRPPCHRSGEHSYKSMYGRLKLDEAAQTITSGFGSPGQGRFVHPTQLRTLTPHEAARLQFFPDFFDFSLVKKRGPLASMIGNAAPMKLSYVFGLELLS